VKNPSREVHERNAHYQIIILIQDIARFSLHNYWRPNQDSSSRFYALWPTEDRSMTLQIFGWLGLSTKYLQGHAPVLCRDPATLLHLVHPVTWVLRCLAAARWQFHARVPRTLACLPRRRQSALQRCKLSALAEWLNVRVIIEQNNYLATAQLAAAETHSPRALVDTRRQVMTSDPAEIAAIRYQQPTACKWQRLPVQVMSCLSGMVVTFQVFSISILASMAQME